MLTFILVLHPKYKSAYLKNKGWERDWIKTAVDILHEIWKEMYLAKVTEGKAEKGKKRTYDEIEDWEGTYRATDDELDVYLSSPTISSVGDPVVYWQSQARTGLASEPFVRMAIDYLSCPGEPFAVFFLFYTNN